MGVEYVTDPVTNKHYVKRFTTIDTLHFGDYFLYGNQAARVVSKHLVQDKSGIWLKIFYRVNTGEITFMINEEAFPFDRPITRLDPILEWEWDLLFHAQVPINESDTSVNATNEEDELLQTVKDFIEAKKDFDESRKALTAAVDKKQQAEEAFYIIKRKLNKLMT